MFGSGEPLAHDNPLIFSSTPDPEQQDSHKKPMRPAHLLPVLALLTAPLATAALVWDGSANGISLYNEDNWTDDNGGTPAGGTIDGGTAVTAATGGEILINSGTGTPSNFSPAFVLGTGNNLTVGNGKNLASGSGAGVTGDGTANLTVTTGGNIGTGTLSGFHSINVNGASTINLVGAAVTTGAGTGGLSVSGNSSVGTGTVSGFTSITVADSSLNMSGSNGIQGLTIGDQFDISGSGSVSSQFVLNWDLTLAGSSTLQLNGGGDPINNTQIDLDPNWTGSILTTSEAVADWTDSGSSNPWRGDANATHLDKITVGGNAAVIGVNVNIVSDGGSGAILTVIPEPSIALLSGLGLLVLFRRRK